MWMRKISFQEGGIKERLESNKEEIDASTADPSSVVSPTLEERREGGKCDLAHHAHRWYSFT